MKSFITNGLLISGITALVSACGGGSSSSEQDGMNQPATTCMTINIQRNRSAMAANNCAFAINGSIFTNNDNRIGPFLIPANGRIDLTSSGLANPEVNVTGLTDCQAPAKPVDQNVCR